MFALFILLYQILLLKARNKIGNIIKITLPNTPQEG